MNITVRVLSAQAQREISRLQSQVALLEKQVASTTAASAGGLVSPRATKSLTAYGSQLQWTGRQLQYNWTLPILAAGAAATKFALDNEKAFTQVSKLYGSLADSTDYFRKHQEQIPQGMTAAGAAAKAQNNELQALEKSFVALSNRYGVAQKDVLETAGAWAAAGSSGAALAKSTNLSLETAILGDMSLNEATTALISTQAQYGLSTKQLTATIADMNAIEDETGISMQGLVTGFSKTAGVAREYGVDVRHLGAMLAALVPAAGSASTAGNALKTMMTRVMVPTQDAIDVMKAFGVDTTTAAFNSSTAMERLTMLSDKMSDSLKKSSDGGYKLSDAQKAVVGSVLGTNYQVNRFLVLMRAIGTQNSYYYKALDATSNKQEVFARATRELNTVLESNPRRLQIIWNTLKNGMADAVTPLIPYLIYLAQTIANMVKWFSNLNPGVQKFIMFLLLMLAAVGPIVKYFGSLATLIGTVGNGFKWLAGIFGLTGAQGAVAAAGTKAAAAAVAEGAAVSEITKRSYLDMIKALTITPIATFAGGVVGVWKKMGDGVRKVTEVLYSGMAPLVAAGEAGITDIAAAGAQARVATEAAGGAERVAAQAAVVSASVAMEATYSAERAAVDEALYTYLLNIFNAYNAAKYGIAAASNASMMALEAGYAGERIVAEQVVAGEVLAIQAGTSAKSAGIFATMFGRLRGLVSGGMAGLSRVLVGAGEGIVAVLTSPWTLAAAAVVALLVIFRKQIAQVWNNIVSYFSDSSNEMTQQVLDAWNALPEGVTRSLVAVAKVVQTVALQIYDWFSYINPFAHHSPSLVENVTNGTAVVSDQFARMAVSIGGSAKSAYNQTNAFGVTARRTAETTKQSIDGLVVTANNQINAYEGSVKKLLALQTSLEEASNRRRVKKYAPGALNDFDALVATLIRLQKAQDALKVSEDKQQAVVDGWTKKIKNANAALDAQQAILNKLQNREQKYQDKLDAAKSALDTFTSAQITGQKAMSDAIFENEMAQKKLQLQLMKMGDAGQGIDSITSKLNALNGAREVLMGQKADLRAGGAGSEITGSIDAQIAAVNKQRDSLGQAAKSVSDLNAQLTALQNKGQELDLENSLKFDPLTRQIEAASKAIKEMPFSQIMAGVKASAAQVAVYQGKLDLATLAVHNQQTAVDNLTASRDKLQASMQKEQDRLDKIKDRYQKVSQAISDAKSALSDSASAADAVAQAKKDKKKKAKHLSPAMQDFNNAAGANFAEVGGKIPIRKNWADQSAQIQKLTEKWSKQAGKAFGSINPFEPVKRAWNAAKGWLSKQGSEWGGAISDMFSHAFKGIDVGKLNPMGIIKKIFDTSKIRGRVLRLDKLISPDVKNALGGLSDSFDEFKKKILPQVQKAIQNFIPFVKSLGQEMKFIWEKVKPLAELLGGALLVAFKLVASIIGHTIGPILSFFIDTIGNFMQVLNGVIEFLTGVFTGDWKMAWQGIKDILGGTLKEIWDAFSGFGKVLWGIVKGIVEGIFGFFKWLKYVLIGDPIVYDIIDGIKHAWTLLKDLGKWIWDHVLKPIVDFFKSMWNDHIKPTLNNVVNGWKNIWNALKGMGKWVWDNILSPVWNKFKDLWQNVKNNLGSWWDNITGLWSSGKNALTGLGGWLKQHVTDPIFNKMTGVWTDIKNWFNNNKDLLTKPVTTIVNTVIGAVDKIIGGLNKVSDILPGISWHIDPIEKLAQGGAIASRRVGSGFKTSGARAIVGEGKQNHPEFVIPTDPTYRSRAKSLLAAAASKMGVSLQGAGGDSQKDMLRVARENPSQFANSVPEFAIGGVLGGIWGGAKGFANKVADLPAQAVDAVMDPLLDLASGTIKKAGWTPVEIPPLSLVEKLRDWTTDADSAISKTAAAATGGIPKKNISDALAFARAQVGKPYVWGASGPDGYDCSGFMSAITDVLVGGTPYARRGATGSFPWSGFESGALKNGFTIGSTKSYAGGVGHMAGTLGGVNVESRGGVGPIVGPSARGYTDSGFNTVAHLAMRNGGIVRHRQGGIIARVGEGRHDEAVIPLPKSYQAMGDGGLGANTEYHFHGDLSFPNIKSADDAQAFLDNLQNLVKD